MSLPDIYLRIEKIINDPNSSARHVADVISQDPNLSAKLLKIVNSAFYGFKNKIDTISRAVTIVGHNQIRRSGPGDIGDGPLSVGFPAI